MEISDLIAVRLQLMSKRLIVNASYYQNATNIHEIFDETFVKVNRNYKSMLKKRNN